MGVELEGRVHDSPRASGECEQAPPLRDRLLAHRPARRPEDLAHTKSIEAGAEVLLPARRIVEHAATDSACELARIGPASEGTRRVMPAQLEQQRERGLHM